MTRNRFAAFFCTSLICVAGSVFAQVPNLGQTYEFGRQNGQIADNAISETAPDGIVKFNGPKASGLTYTPSTSRTKANIRNFITKTRARDASGAADMERMFAQIDVMGEIGKAMRGVGLDKNNSADAFALYWVAAWQATYGDKGTKNRVTYEAVARQAAAGLSQSPEFARATNAQKQEMAEALMVQAAMIDGAVAASPDAATLRKVGAAVMQGAKATGLDLDKMTLTEKGFVRSDKASDAGAAIDAADPTANDTALASADGAVQDSEGLSKTQLTLIAGAAGAGIASIFFLGRASGRRG